MCAIELAPSCEYEREKPGKATSRVHAEQIQVNQRHDKNAEINTNSPMHSLDDWNASTLNLIIKIIPLHSRVVSAAI